MNEPQAIAVEIYDQVYNLRGTDADLMQRLASVVDSKMRAVAAQGTTVDTMRVAVLAALNLADELERAKAKYEALQKNASRTETSVRSRADSLSGLLDSVLDERRAG